MLLTKDVEKDLMEILTMVGFDREDARHVIWAASEDDTGKASQEWALRTIEKAIIRVAEIKEEELEVV